ncbi:hypothetical protein ABZ864_08655 [Streptomyces sp. NPDC047082]|uniref:hypothetical protein n=1 Tax=Streptomyces sp. NPDC047082 TaxID=3155259 RepID=UPI0033EB48F4
MERARRIVLLRAVGMPLSDITTVLQPSGEESAGHLDAYWRRQERSTARAEHWWPMRVAFSQERGRPCTRFPSGTSPNRRCSTSSAMFRRTRCAAISPRRPRGSSPT